jgi:acyl-coenzyme A synthetase/AMP-(fatty) acid ligase
MVEQKSMLISKIFDHARKTPEKTAVVHNQQAISYALFAQCIETMRSFLRTKELPPRGIAVIYAPNLFEAWILSLSVRSLGLDALVLPMAECLDQVGLSNIACVVAGASEAADRAQLRESCATAGTRLIRASLPEITHPHPIPAESPNRLAEAGTILLTSGTTGSFKKLKIDRCADQACSEWRQLLYGISGQSVVNVLWLGGWTSVGYRLPACAWSAGGCAVFYQGLDPWASLDFPGITHLWVTPRMLAQILSVSTDVSRRNDEMRLYVGGGALSEAMAAAARARLTKQIFTTYASTEAEVVALTRIESLEDLRSHSVLPSRKVEVVDENDRALPVDQEGIIRVDAFPFIWGYLHDEEATTAFFRNGYFYPGDLCKVRVDGRLELRGRVTDIVNILGHKFAP